MSIEYYALNSINKTTTNGKRQILSKRKLPKLKRQNTKLIHLKMINNTHILFKGHQLPKITKVALLSYGRFKIRLNIKQKNSYQCEGNLLRGAVAAENIIKWQYVYTA